ncbi:Polypeptide N-acetylgalactosaminyltransferase [Actinidia chinensis var. chinensis]|uniref:Polypeptide N-acetylgalactosaminyltransferase n=1 Tax=Actinidia chinensis var. chinensis TaxID=1590841 RepID=A0A2R6QPH2_ACTCC|nr:Polypeptide N-acetylgalactosaminyltransferase [Actinidia chinensis var. chinensis]
MVVLVDELVESLKHFSLCTESLGCVHSAVFRSIHGNMIIWYGAWMKRSNENKELLNATLLSMLTNVSSMAILIDYSFFDAYAGESRDGSPAAKFFTGDTISMNAILLHKNNTNDLSYALLAIFKSHLAKMDGVVAGVCLKCHSQTRTVNLFVWKSLQCCYSWILKSDYRKTLLPFLDHLPFEVKYDMFRAVYVSGDNVLTPSHIEAPFGRIQPFKGI